MGPKPSRQSPHLSSSEQQPYYQNNVRQYAKWDHRSGLVSDDAPRFALQEIQNLQRHNQLTSALASQTPMPQKKVITSTPRSEINAPIYKHNQNPTPFIKKPRYDPNVRGKPLGLRKSQSTDHLPNASLISAQQLLEDQAKRRQRHNSSSSQLATQAVRRPGVQRSTSTVSANQSKTLKPKRKKIPSDLQLIMINSNDLQNAREIGKGNFGTVYHALYKGTRDVALKTMNSQDGNSLQGGSVSDYDENLSELLHEANIMTHLKHANLLSIIGVTFFGDKQQLSLVTDYMRNGSLLDYLKKHRETFLKADSRIITNRLNSFATQIFEAMSYLEERDIIHRDLAARNCLIGEGDTLKVGDFGLSTLTEYGLYKGTYRTICAPRWTSPEAFISSKYSSRSDVWSYGITLWEIYSLGERPFGNMTNFAVQIILKNSSENLSHHLPKPRQFGSDETYTHIILPCLTYNVLMRPRFRDLNERLINILTDRT